jgi:hypothetical protein
MAQLPFGRESPVYDLAAVSGAIERRGVGRPLDGRDAPQIYGKSLIRCRSDRCWRGRWARS